VDGIVVVEVSNDFQWLDHDFDSSPAWTTGNYNLLPVTLRVMILKVSRAPGSEFR
jgi:hypothetical protein